MLEELTVWNFILFILLAAGPAWLLIALDLYLGRDCESHADAIGGIDDLEVLLVGNDAEGSGGKVDECV